MTPNGWRNSIGKDAFDYIVHVSGGSELEVSRALAAAHEVGFVPPVRAPQVSSEGTRVMFGGAPALTSGGLLAHWRSRGHGWLILRTTQLGRALAGPLMARMQEIAAAYEEQCRIDGVAPAPDWAGFVGGFEPDPVRAFTELQETAPPVTAQRVTVAGPK